MEALKKRHNAVIIFVVVVIVFTLIGCHRSLSKACRNVEVTFFEKGAFADQGYYSAPGDQLTNCVNLANRLLSVINGSEDLADGYEAILSARQDLMDALSTADISDIYDANADLVAAVDLVTAKVDAGVALPSSSDDYDSIIADFYSAQAVVRDSPYNDYVDDFIHSTIRSFPTGILRVISFVSLPEKFA